jgi:hypothetical protein
MAAYTTIDNPELYFQVKLYTGNSTDDHAITLDGSENMQPDMVWVKGRSNAGYNHNIYDAVRGANKYLRPNSSGAEVTVSDALKSFDSDGFTLDDDATNDEVNDNTITYVAWSWKAGAGSGSSNTDGSINTASTSVSTTSGFSISKYVGTGSNATVGHSLGVAPKMYIVKDLGATSGWRTYTEATGNQSQLALDQNSSADSGNTTMWNSTSPTSTVFSIGTHSNVNTSSNNYIAYCFASKSGYSKFGTYKGNGNADGTYIHLGLRPAFVMLKRTDAVDSWFMYDNKRSPSNVVNDYIIADGSGAEVSTSAVNLDLLSNGFKIRNTDNGHNNSSGTYFYMAFAESPFVNSNGVPNNAR